MFNVLYILYGKSKGDFPVFITILEIKLPYFVSAVFDLLALIY